jgi:hypothetical protein
MILGIGRGRGGRPRGMRKPGRTFCQCPSCGHFEPHILGDPCCRYKCPVCGTRLLGISCLDERRREARR